MTALIAIFSMDASPSPGSNRPTTSSRSLVVAASIASTRALVAGCSGRPSPDWLRRNLAFIASSASSTSGASNVSHGPSVSSSCHSACSTPELNPCVRPATIWSKPSSTIEWMNAASWFTNGWGIRAYGRPARPIVSALRLWSSTKWSATKATVGTPRFSISLRSWTSHDVQPPQSPVVPTTASQVAAIFSVSPGVRCRTVEPMDPTSRTRLTSG